MTRGGRRERSGARLLRQLGGRYATALGIDLGGGPAGRFKWLLASILYGGSLGARG